MISVNHRINLKILIKIRSPMMCVVIIHRTIVLLTSLVSNGQLFHANDSILKGFERLPKDQFVDWLLQRSKNDIHVDEFGSFRSTIFEQVVGTVCLKKAYGLKKRIKRGETSVYQKLARDGHAFDEITVK